MQAFSSRFIKRESLPPPQQPLLLLQTRKGLFKVYNFKTITVLWIKYKMCKVLKLLHGAVTFTMKWTFMRPDLMWLKREWYFDIFFSR